MTAVADMMVAVKNTMVVVVVDMLNRRCKVDMVDS
jgi:hypothetical protein